MPPPVVRVGQAISTPRRRLLAEYRASMGPEPVLAFEPPEYARPVIPAGLTEDQEDELLSQMMDQLLAGRSPVRASTATDVRVRALGGDFRLGDDVVDL